MLNPTPVTVTPSWEVTITQAPSHEELTPPARPTSCIRSPPRNPRKRYNNIYYTQKPFATFTPHPCSHPRLPSTSYISWSNSHVRFSPSLSPYKEKKVQLLRYLLPTSTMAASLLLALLIASLISNPPVSMSWDTPSPVCPTCLPPPTTAECPPPPPAEPIGYPPPSPPSPGTVFYPSPPPPPVYYPYFPPPIGYFPGPPPPNPILPWFPWYYKPHLRRHRRRLTVGRRPQSGCWAWYMALGFILV
ncbi:hypothetical protein HPP92_026224 [Vanilla planifolia]|uniref:Uncharacterized protein n=1 Tax=Vanilla planifolia TaxID=51239 RepID=A0A835PD23_VANPL|nr:hypothetical protein HPP92_026224 [Vanilla planifolia]